MSLNTLQNLTNNNNKVNSILVKINSNANVTDVSNIIDNTYPNELSTVTSTTQSNMVNQALSTIDMANWLFSVIAIIIGRLGIINTMSCLLMKEPVNRRFKGCGLEGTTNIRYDSW